MHLDRSLVLDYCRKHYFSWYLSVKIGHLITATFTSSYTWELINSFYVIQYLDIAANMMMSFIKDHIVFNQRQQTFTLDLR